MELNPDKMVRIMWEIIHSEQGSILLDAAWGYLGSIPRPLDG